MTIRGVLFDKDGTLFDFEATWCEWAAHLLLDLAQGDRDRAAALGGRIGYDFTSERFAQDSPVIAGTPAEIAALLAPDVPAMPGDALIDHINEMAAVAPQVEVVPLAPLLASLRARGLKLGVATNDAEAPARSHLMGAGQTQAFDFIAGSDSGHGAKPDPGLCLAFARAVSLAPDAVAMVGDSTHDMHAGRSAGMICVAVLSGLATADELAPLADFVLADVGALVEWLDSQIT